MLLGLKRQQRNRKWDCYLFLLAIVTIITITIAVLNRNHSKHFVKRYARSSGDEPSTIHQLFFLFFLYDFLVLVVTAWEPLLVFPPATPPMPSQCLFKMAREIVEARYNLVQLLCAAEFQPKTPVRVHAHLPAQSMRRWRPPWRLSQPRRGQHELVSRRGCDYKLLYDRPERANC